jgi:hypothetical protein
LFVGIKNPGLCRLLRARSPLYRKDRVLFIQNGNPAILRVVNIVNGATEKEFTLETANLASVHGQFRRARLTDAGTLLVAHMDMKKLSEYDSAGKEVWSVAIESPCSAVRLKDGNTLIASNKKVVQRGGSQRTDGLGVQA